MSDSRLARKWLKHADFVDSDLADVALRHDENVFMRNIWDVTDVDDS